MRFGVKTAYAIYRSPEPVSSHLPLFGMKVTLMFLKRQKSINLKYTLRERAYRVLSPRVSLNFVPQRKKFLTKEPCWVIYSVRAGISATPCSHRVNNYPRMPLALVLWSLRNPVFALFHLLQLWGPLRQEKTHTFEYRDPNLVTDWWYCQ